MSKYFKKRMQSFKYAFQGISTLFRETPNAVIHVAMAVLAILLGFVFCISTTEWLSIILVIGLVLALEAINTALENLADFACKKETHTTIKKVKDLAAAGVLLASAAALAVGTIVFLPKIIDALK